MFLVFFTSKASREYSIRYPVAVRNNFARPSCAWTMSSRASLMDSGPAQIRAQLKSKLVILRALNQALQVRQQLEASLVQLAELNLKRATVEDGKIRRRQSRDGKTRRRNAQLRAQRETLTYSGMLGEDTIGCTDERMVARIKISFLEWNHNNRGSTPRQHKTCDLTVTADIRPGVSKAKSYRFKNKICKEQLDSRLSLAHMYYLCGLRSRHLFGRSRVRLTPLQRLRYIIGLMPECLYVPQTADLGEYFWPVDEAWLESADQYHGWVKPLTHLIARRIEYMMQSDSARIIAGAVSSPQPAGRYLNYADYISRWNASCGKCPCGKNIFLGAEDTWLKDSRGQPIPPDGVSQACVQRMDTSIIHLEWNCGRTLICSDCSEHATYNVTHHMDKSSHPVAP